MFTKKIRQNSNMKSCYSYILKPLNPVKQKQLIYEVEKLCRRDSHSPEKEFYYFKVDSVYYPVRIDELVDFGNSKWLSRVKGMIRCD